TCHNQFLVVAADTRSAERLQRRCPTRLTSRWRHVGFACWGSPESPWIRSAWQCAQPTGKPSPSAGFQNLQSSSYLERRLRFVATNQGRSSRFRIVLLAAPSRESAAVRLFEPNGKPQARS